MSRPITGQAVRDYASVLRADVVARVVEQVNGARREIGSLVIAMRHDEAPTLLPRLDLIEKLQDRLDQLEAAVREGEQR